MFVRLLTTLADPLTLSLGACKPHKLTLQNTGHVQVACGSTDFRPALTCSGGGCTILLQCGTCCPNEWQTCRRA